VSGRLGGATRVYVRLTLLRLARGRLPLLIALVCLLPILAAAGLAAGGGWGRGLFDELIDVYFRFLVPFGPALLLAPHIAEEAERRTVSLLFARPAPRAALVLGKLACVGGLLALAAALSIPAVFAIAMARFPGDVPDQLTHLARAEGGAALGIVVFAALAQALGALFVRHAVLGALAVLAADAGLSSLPVALRGATWHLRNLVDLPQATPYLGGAPVSPLFSLGVLLVLGALALTFACWRVTTSEYAVES
jgi:ABC-type transport system involved in multi-copper enzyme maturation permease subunit